MILLRIIISFVFFQRLIHEFAAAVLHINFCRRAIVDQNDAVLHLWISQHCRMNTKRLIMRSLVNAVLAVIRPMLFIPGHFGPRLAVDRMQRRLPERTDADQKRRVHTLMEQIVLIRVVSEFRRFRNFRSIFAFLFACFLRGFEHVDRNHISCILGRARKPNSET